MARILITSGPTRQYLDPVRYLTNASSGRMGAALAAAVIEAGHEAVVVSGPVDVEYPAACRVRRVLSTEEMLAACLDLFPACDGLIAAAAPSDYKPAAVSPSKIRKTGGPLVLELVETPDVVAALAARKSKQWIVVFALETEDAHIQAIQKLERKNCDLVVVNGPGAIHAAETTVDVLDRTGEVLLSAAGEKGEVARRLLAVVERRLIAPAAGAAPPTA